MAIENYAPNACVDILSAWQLNALDTQEAIAQLCQLLKANPSYAEAFGVDVTHDMQCAVWIEAQLHLFEETWDSLSQLCQQSLQISPYPTAMAWNLWLPLASRLATLRETAGRPIVQGVLGGQGTGKTTLATVLTHLLTHMGYRVCGISIDDLYKTYSDRQTLMEQEPRLRWRGPPGTHDVDLGLEVLRQLKQADGHGPIAIPRFDKSLHEGAGDRVGPEVIEGADIILFEGWFVGVRPVEPSVFDHAPPPILTEADRHFARDINIRLRDYLPLWGELDSLMVLYPTDYRLSQKWRQQAETKMKAAGKSGMSDEEVQEFVNYFWRSLHPDLFIKPLLSQPEYVDLVVEVKGDRSIHAIYRPQK